MTVEKFEYVIIGGGAGGAVVAARLAEHADVLLLEAGTATGDSTDVLTPGRAAGLPSSTAVRTFETVPQTAVAGRRVPLVVGSGLGGGSAVNALAWLHGHPTDYDRWAAAGAADWHWDAVAPWIRATERFEIGRAPQRGDCGPITVSTIPDAHPAALAFLAVAQERGLPISDDLNADGGRTGVGLAQADVRHGRRDGVVQAYLEPALARTSLEVRTGHEVLAVTIEHGRAVGVLVRSGDRHNPVLEIEAIRGVVLAAGALGTPQVLLRSGIGPAPDLVELGIPVERDAPRVGLGLQDHPAVALPVERHAVPSADEAEAAYTYRRGPLASYPQVIACIAAPPHHRMVARPPDITFGLDFWQPGVRGDESSGGCLVGLLAPKSRGSVRLSGRDLGAEPVIDPAYLSGDTDRARLREGIRLALELLTSGPVREHADMPLDLDPRDPGVLDDLIDKELVTYYHPVGTAAMGGADAVVDPTLQVKGVERLWISDASVMPRIIRGYPHAPTIMIGERAASFIRRAGS